MNTTKETEVFSMRQTDETLMKSIPDAARTTGLSQFALRKLANDGTITTFRSGIKIYVHMPSLRAYLENPTPTGRLARNLGAYEAVPESRRITQEELNQTAEYVKDTYGAEVLPEPSARP
jgi:hypothetical protein